MEPKPALGPCTGRVCPRINEPMRTSTLALAPVSVQSVRCALFVDEEPSGSRTLFAVLVWQLPVGRRGKKRVGGGDGGE